jgi:hypothetical protein
MISQHTPGPWYRNIRAAGKYPIIFSGDAPNHEHIAQALQLRGRPDEVEANIDLIAAAPALLAALRLAEQILAMVPDHFARELPGGYGAVKGATDEARAAIAAATEKQS